MLNRSKALWLTLLPVFAVSALGASAASASHLAFHATGEPDTTLLGRADAGENNIVTTAGTAHCSEEEYIGTIPASSTPTTLTVEAMFSGCEVTPIGHAIVDMNGCTLQFHAGETDVNGKKEGSTDALCPAGEEMTVTATVGGTTKCTLHVPPQEGLEEVTYTAIGTGSTEEGTIDVNLTGLKYTHTKGTGFGACATGEGNNATFTAKVLLTGENTATGEHVGVIVAHESH